MGHRPTTHDIAAFRNYKDGKGDIVREFTDAFRKRGLKVGFYYCAPGDFDNRFGNTLPTGKPSLQGMPPEAAGDFHGFIKKQFTELLTKYGPIDLICCDQYSNKFNMNQWHEIMGRIKKFQPNCLVLANNSHNSRDTDIHSFEFPIYRSEKGYPPANNTTPSEVCDTLAANGAWFWHPDSEKQMRSAADIVGVLRKCNTRRANYLLDVPPDRTGRIPEALVARLKEIGRLLTGS